MLEKIVSLLSNKLLKKEIKDKKVSKKIRKRVRNIILTIFFTIIIIVIFFLFKGYSIEDVFKSIFAVIAGLIVTLRFLVQFGRELINTFVIEEDEEDMADKN